MKKVVFSILLGVLALNAYPQNSQGKLLGAGKGTKVGTESPPQKTTISPGKQNPNGGKKNKIVDSNEKYASSGYMSITDLSFANIDSDNNIIDNYGKKLYAKEVKYLSPRITYKGLANTEKQITLNVKIFDEDGQLQAGTNSPEGFTYSKDINVEPGEGKFAKLSGWGTSAGGSYNAGLYKFEVWYKNKMLCQKEIRLYSGTTPISTSNLLSISSVSFANTDKNGNIINDYGQTLYDGKVQYLKPKLYYYGKYSSNQEALLYIRYFKSSGDLVSGTTSPLGFSYKETITIKPGSNNLTLTAYGNESATNYKEGTCKVEIWIDGEKLYETSVKIKSGTDDYYSNSIFEQLFPLWGITLGKTTWKQAEDAGYVVKKWKDGPGRYTDVGDVTFWDHKGEGKLTEIYWLNYDADFPASWKEKGFSWNNSYNAWLSTLRDLGFTIKVTKDPKTKEWQGRNTLSADVKAISPDGILELDLDFDYGKNGYYTSSPKTLYSITFRYKGN